MLLILSFTIFADTEKSVCTVSKIRGEVKAKMPDGKIVVLEKDLSLPEGSIIKTSDKSFVKLVFIDESTMSVGVNSIVKITSFPKDKAGILTLVRGQIRSKVTKDYMEIEDKNKSKLFIRTRSAAMGIRGTDFQVNFDDAIEETTLVTYEGRVAMNKLDNDQRERELNQVDLDRVLERKERIIVNRGEISNINRETRRMERPVRLDIKMIESLKSSEAPREKINERKIIQKEEMRKPERLDNLNGKQERSSEVRDKREGKREDKREDKRERKREEKRAEMKEKRKNERREMKHEERKEIRREQAPLEMR